MLSWKLVLLIKCFQGAHKCEQKVVKPTAKTSLKATPLTKRAHKNLKQERIHSHNKREGLKCRSLGFFFKCSGPDSEGVKVKKMTRQGSRRGGGGGGH